ncbi:hypothetical protein MKX54_10435 [Alkalihalobacillus sp. FSL R5-0424]
MAKSNRKCVQCHAEVPHRKIYFKGIANRRLICPSCKTEQQVGFKVLLIQYLFFVSYMIFMMINVNFIRSIFISYLVLALILSQLFIFEPFKKLEPLKEKQPH